MPLSLLEQRGTACHRIKKERKKGNEIMLHISSKNFWLPVKLRCQYKVATLAYRHFQGSLPPYLSSSLRSYEPSRSLRSSKEKLLKIPRGNLNLSGNFLPVSWRRLFGLTVSRCQKFANIISIPI